jgi:hypothetical protein
MSNKTAVDGPWEQNVSAHVVHFVPPDLFTIHVDGEIVPEHIAAFASLLGRAGSTFYMVIHTAKLTSVASRAKRKVGELPRAAGVAYVGASRQTKLILRLMDRVYTMLSFGKNSPITFVATDEEARQWVDDLRSRKKASAPA